MTARVRSLDGLRGVAVAFVLLLHLSYGHFPGGFIGVDIFFVLSGYLITITLRRPGNTLRRFYIRRARRLGPALVVAIVLCLLTWPMTCGSLRFWPAAVSAIAYVADFAAMRDAASLGTLLPCWSLAIEEQFYIIWPAALMVLQRSREPWIYAAGAAVASATARAVFHTSYFSPITHLDSVLAGCTLALLPGKPPRSPSLAWALAIALPLLGVRSNLDDASYYVWVSPMVTVALLALIVEAQLPGRLSAALSFGPLVWLGQRSYGIYLYQLPIILSSESLRKHRDIGNFVAVTVARTAATLVLSEVSFRLVESPILNGSVRSRRPVVHVDGS